MSIQLEINKAIEILSEGGTILCPTDTVWGLSADATNSQAVKTLFEIKERPGDKSLIVLVSSLEMLKDYVESIPPLAFELIANSTEPTSVIYPKAKNLASNVYAENLSVAIRIVQDEFCKTLIEKYGKPIVSTSANISGKASPKSYCEISDIIKSRVDYCVKHPGKEKEQGKSSSIFLVEADGVRQIR